MERSERLQPMKLLQNFGCNYDRTVEAGASVYHPVPNAEDPRSSVEGSNPPRQGVQSAAAVPRFGRRSIRLNLALGILRDESRRRADAIDTAPRFEAPVFERVPAINSELQTRRSCVEYESEVVHI
jgi:hypothetical protein